MNEFLQVVTFGEALQLLRDNFPLRRSVYMPLAEAVGAVVASDIISPEALPAFDRSTVDGYAVNAADTYGSSESLPAFMAYAGEIAMGCEAGIVLTPGQCAWIPTGGMLPGGANAAVMVEYTEKLADDTVLIYRPVGPWENIMQTGEDVAGNQLIFSTGHRLRPQDIGLLASLGIQEVKVYDTFEVGVISTGNEIIPVAEQPSIGQVRDVNSLALAAALKLCGARVNNYPIIPDDFDRLQQAVDQALSENDVLLLSGGSSVGIKDMTLDVLLKYPEASLLFHGLAVKPGKPTLGVRIGKKLAIGLPGHPVSALMMFHITCAPLLRSEPSFWREGKLDINLASQPGRDDFIPVQLKEAAGGGLMVHPLLGKSGLMSILALADGYVHIGYQQQGLKAGEQVKVVLF
ncbi:MAG: molybdopterin molybdotransferase MoeA [Syntrophomonadaceae bacterium]|nr:molybdopterin molybdotransferase MoeA [Syntrophomonadaceae bacterium]